MTNELDPELKRIFLACLDYGKTQDAPQPVICYSWVARRHEAMSVEHFIHRDFASLSGLGCSPKMATRRVAGVGVIIESLLPTEPMNISGEPMAVVVKRF